MEHKIFTVAIIGCGNRGSESYGQLIAKIPECYQLVAACDINPKRLENVKNELNIPEEGLFNDEAVFFEEKRADILLIATQDADHVRQAVKALSLGYDLILEKPLTQYKEECEELLAAQRKYGGKVLVCHVLRYAPAFVKVAELLDAGKIGRLVCINAVEQVGYWHQAHSFVRGSWRKSEEASPMVLAKTCHDLDFIQYYAKSRCKSVSSVGDLTFFTPENAPEGAAKRCLDCPHVDTCPYSAKTVYLGRFLANKGDWPTNVITTERPMTEEAIMKALREGPYGRCVFHCDNDVVDHQITTMTFENGVKANLIMTGFARGFGRRISFCGTYGEIVINEDEDYVKVMPFAGGSEKWKISDLINTTRVGKGAAHDGHGGGDIGLIEKAYEVFSGKADPATSLEASVESHLMGIAAEESRLVGGKLVYIHEND